MLDVIIEICIAQGGQKRGLLPKADFRVPVFTLLATEIIVDPYVIVQRSHCKNVENARLQVWNYVTRTAELGQLRALGPQVHARGIARQSCDEFEIQPKSRSLPGVIRADNVKFAFTLSKSGAAPKSLH